MKFTFRSVIAAHFRASLKPGVKLELVGEAKSLPWSRSLFNGLAQIIVQSTKEAGEIKLTATAAGLMPAMVVLESKPCPPRPAVRKWEPAWWLRVQSMK